MATKLSVVEKDVLRQIVGDPALWAKAFLRTYDQAAKKVVPWTARWYQIQMMRDKSKKRVARCGRRTGEKLPSIGELRGRTVICILATA